MRIVFLYRPNSEHGRITEDYARDFTMQQGGTIELISLETKEGAEMAKLYDVVAYPAALVIDHDNSLHKFWQGDEMPPLMQELAAYSRG